MKQSIEESIKVLKEAAEAVADRRDNAEIDPDDHVEEYEEMLNDSAGNEIVIGNITLCVTPAELLKEQDPTAYRCGLNDFVDGLDVTETNEYRRLDEWLDRINDAVADLQDLLEEIEEEG